MSVDSEPTADASLSKLLERVAEAQAAKARVEADLKKANEELRQLENLAVEQLALSGLDGVRAAGKSWRLREFFAVNVPAANRDKVLAAARTVCPEIVSVNTASLKSWLNEERKRRGDTGESLAAGTPFDGLVSEFREVRLAHLTVG